MCDERDTHEGCFVRFNHSLSSVVAILWCFVSLLINSIAKRIQFFFLSLCTLWFSLQHVYVHLLFRFRFQLMMFGVILLLWYSVYIFVICQTNDKHRKKVTIENLFIRVHQMTCGLTPEIHWEIEIFQGLAHVSVRVERQAAHNAVTALQATFMISTIRYNLWRIYSLYNHLKNFNTNPISDP